MKAVIIMATPYYICRRETKARSKSTMLPKP